MRSTELNSAPPNTSESSQLTESSQLSEASQLEAAQFESRLYSRLDSQLFHPKQTTSWIPPGDLLISISHLKKEINIKEINCSNEFCRYEIQCLTDKAATSIPVELSVEGSIIFRYFENNEKKIVAYIFQPNINTEKYLQDA